MLFRTSQKTSLTIFFIDSADLQDRSGCPHMLFRVAGQKVQSCSDVGTPCHDLTDEVSVLLQSAVVVNHRGRRQDLGARPRVQGYSRPHKSGCPLLAWRAQTQMHGRCRPLLPSPTAHCPWPMNPEPFRRRQHSRRPFSSHASPRPGPALPGLPALFVLRLQFGSRQVHKPRPRAPWIFLSSCLSNRILHNRQPDAGRDLADEAPSPDRPRT